MFLLRWDALNWAGLEVFTEFGLKNILVALLSLFGYAWVVDSSFKPALAVTSVNYGGTGGDLG